MARRKKTHDTDDETLIEADDMSTETTKPTKRKPVIIDYRGYIGRGTIEKGGITNDRAVLHRLSPMSVLWPVNGQADLHLQPGCNVVDGDLWHFYTKEAKGQDGSPGAPQLMEKINKGYVRELSGLPQDLGGLHDLIDRSIDHDGLRWIADQERRGANRQEVLDAVEARLAKARPVRVKAIAFQQHVPAIKDSDAPQPSLAMG